MSKALLLAGHGSHLNSRSSEAVRAHARKLASTGVWDEVRVAFWKEEPSLARALDGCVAEDVTVVPVFMSEGYFTSDVIPTEMDLEGPVTRRRGRTVRCTDPVGVHPALADIIVERALEVGTKPVDVVFVLGHGTDRNVDSSNSVHQQIKRVSTLDRFAEVFAVFTDQEPNIRSVLDLAQGRAATIVPFFVSEGWHVGQVAAEGAAGIRYTEPAGTHRDLATVITDLAQEVLSSEKQS
ncbi:MAG TPA: cobalamin biosynthesis protein CbiX [Dehalococcoidia bacterium]|nr:cobalamin biosynthesis protein CbiX [Dehalococcoidia bacterium]